MASNGDFKIGIIGGTGLEDPQILENAKKIHVTTPYGKPSDDLLEGNIGGVPCVLLSRHGRQHQWSPSQVNYRANIWALKSLGAKVIIASSASGSLKEEVKPGHIVLLDSFIDRTTRREQSFYDGLEGHPKGICHIPSHPLFSDKLRSILGSCASALGITCHERGTSVCIEGPRYSTRAESDLYRSWNASLVNMTVCPEALLAKELGIPYASVALVTDYDCWKDSHESVSVDLVMKTLHENAENTKRLFIKAVEEIHASKPALNLEISKAKEVAISNVMDAGHKLTFDHI